MYQAREEDIDEGGDGQERDEDQNEDDDDEDEDEDDDEDDDEPNPQTVPSVRGPLPASDKDSIIKWGKKVAEQAKRWRAKTGHSIQHIYQTAGLSLTFSRKSNIFNDFRRWHSMKYKVELMGRKSVT